MDVNAEAKTGWHHRALLIAPGVGIAADAIDFVAAEGTKLGGLEIAVVFAEESAAIANCDHLLEAALAVGLDLDAVIGDRRCTVETGVANGGINPSASMVLANEMPGVAVAGMQGVRFSCALNRANGRCGDGQSSSGCGEGFEEGFGGGGHG